MNSEWWEVGWWKSVWMPTARKEGNFYIYFSVRMMNDCNVIHKVDPPQSKCIKFIKANILHQEGPKKDDQCTHGIILSYSFPCSYSIKNIQSYIYTCVNIGFWKLTKVASMATWVWWSGGEKVRVPKVNKNVVQNLRFSFKRRSSYVVQTTINA